MTPEEKALAVISAHLDECDWTTEGIAEAFATLRAALERGGRGHVQNCRCHDYFGNEACYRTKPCSNIPGEGHPPYRDPRCGQPEPPAQSDAGAARDEVFRTAGAWHRGETTDEPFVLAVRCLAALAHRPAPPEAAALPTHDDCGNEIVWMQRAEVKALQDAAMPAPLPEEVEALAARFHECYQQEAKRQGDVRHKDNYADLPENIKEFDRVLARLVLADRKAAVAERTALMGRLSDEKVRCFVEKAEADRAARIAKVEEAVEEAHAQCPCLRCGCDPERAGYGRKSCCDYSHRAISAIVQAAKEEK